MEGCDNRLVLIEAFGKKLPDKVISLFYSLNYRVTHNER